MQNVLVLSPRDSDGATVTASTEASASLVAANLQDMQPAKKWRSSSTTGEYVLVTFDTAVAANCLAVVGHNLSGSGTIRLRGAVLQANLTTSPDYDSTALSAWPGTGKPTDALWPVYTSLRKNSNTTACRYWRIDFADSAPVTTYLEASRIALGIAWQPSYNFDIGGTPLGFDVPDVQTKTPFGRTFTDRRTYSAPRVFELAFYALTRSESLRGIFEIQRLRGLWGDVICSLDPTETTDFHRYTMQGVFTDRAAYTVPPAFDSGGNMFGAGLRLRELI